MNCFDHWSAESSTITLFACDYRSFSYLISTRAGSKRFKRSHSTKSPAAFQNRYFCFSFREPSGAYGNKLAPWLVPGIALACEPSLRPPALGSEPRKDWFQKQPTKSSKYSALREGVPSLQSGSSTKDYSRHPGISSGPTNFLSWNYRETSIYPSKLRVILASLD